MKKLFFGATSYVGNLVREPFCSTIRALHYGTASILAEDSKILRPFRCQVSTVAAPRQKWPVPQSGPSWLQQGSISHYCSSRRAQKSVWNRGEMCAIRCLSKGAATLTSLVSITRITAAQQDLCTTRSDLKVLSQYDFVICIPLQDPPCACVDKIWCSFIPAILIRWDAMLQHHFMHDSTS